ncbi:MAG: hypothetical protein AAFR77_00135 [Cyanobacteria bacterium J06631_2]
MSENSDYRDSGVDEDSLSLGNNNERDDSWLSIEVFVQDDRVSLLQGLETWFQLGLISQGQIRKIARQRLSCALPSPEVIDVAIEQNLTPAPALVAATPNALQEIWHSFLDELSIRWLLFLGIFLVVVSSAVLAASQWQNFPGYGQYAVLLLYTLSFWAIGFWTGKQNSLRLTSQTLMAIATLLMPINFWAIDHLGLGFIPWEWGIVTLAAISLVGTSYLSFPRNKNIFSLGMFWLLSFLHLGWQLPYLPVITIYGGITAICLLDHRLLRRQRRYPLLALFFVLAAWLLWLTRIMISATDSLPQYSLAIAIFAWLVCSIYLDRARKRKVIALKRKSAAILNAFVGKVGKFCSILLFCLGWLVSLSAGLQVSSLYFWQTVGISLLAIHLFGQRLILYWRKQDLTAIFLIGLQTLYVCKELIPDGWRSQALNTAVVVSQTEYFPESVFGVTLFPYIILWVLLASWLYRQSKRSLGLYSEYLTLFLGLALTCLSFFNPTWRSLNLALSTLTLGYVGVIRQPVRGSLIYLTHLLGLITLVNSIYVIFPSLNELAWGCITLALATLEWSIYLRQIKGHLTNPTTTLINQSCWYFGLLWSAVSYGFLLQVDSGYWGLLWLTTPMMLALIGRYSRKLGHRRLATVASCIALILIQLLVYEPTVARLIALLFATGLMMLNTFNFRRLPIVLIHLAVAIAFVSNVLDLFIPHPPNYYGHWLLIGALVILMLYRLRLYLLKTINTPKFGYISQRNAFGILGVGRETRNFKLVHKYLQATDYWAIWVMAATTLAIASTYLFLPNLRIDQYFWYFLLTTGLLIGAIWWRYRSQPNNLALYTLTGLVGVFATGILRLLSDTSIVFATVNIFLGLVALVVVALVAQGNSPWTKLNLAFVPLVYAAMGIGWRISDFNAYTGLLTLGAAFILINTQPQNQLINQSTKYLGFTAISWGIYELVIYQMQNGSGGSAADALTILSLVAAAIAFSYRFTAYMTASRGKSNTLLNLNLAKVVLIAHIHWAASSVLKVIAAGIVLETNTPRLSLISIATSLCLGAYALIQARDTERHATQQKNNQDWWVYVGLVEIAATLVYSRLIISKLSLFDPWRIVFTCAVALLIYQIPWQSFGWRSTPWRRTALVTPVLMALVTAEDISYFSLLLVALFYLRIAYAQRNVRWSYISLGLVGWLGVRLIIQYNFGLLGIAAIIGASLLYIAQLDPILQRQRPQRHYLRLLGSSLICIAALLEHSGWIPGAIAFGFIFLGLGLRIRALLFTGTITLILTVLHQLIILVFTYSYLKWLVGLLAGIGSIAIAAGFENRREGVANKFKSYQDKLQNWQ